MNRWLLVGVAVIVGVAAARADEKPEPAKPLAPAFVKLKVAADGNLTIEREVQVTAYQPVQETRTVVVNGKPMTVTVTVNVPVTKTQVQVIPGEGYEVQDAAGTKVPTEKLAELLKKDAKALMAADGKPIDPSFLKGAKEGTLVVVAVKKEEPKKEPSPPKP